MNDKNLKLTLKDKCAYEKQKNRWKNYTTARIIVQLPWLVGLKLELKQCRCEPSERAWLFQN
jgi:hypothetical protein